MVAALVQDAQLLPFTVFVPPPQTARVAAHIGGERDGWGARRRRGGRRWSGPWRPDAGSEVAASHTHALPGRRHRHGSGGARVRELLRDLSRVTRECFVRGGFDQRRARGGVGSGQRRWTGVGGEAACELRSVVWCVVCVAGVRA